MIHFNTRNDVIDWAMDHIPESYRSITRSFEEGKVEFLGGFSGYHPGWMIRIISKFNKVYRLLVYVDSLNRPHLAIRTGIDWRYWDGDKTDNPLYQGDFPEKYKELKKSEANQ